MLNIARRCVPFTPYDKDLSTAIVTLVSATGVFAPGQDPFPEEDPGDITQYPDLDAPELWAPLCPPLRRLPSQTWTPEEPSGLRWIPPDVKGTRALDTLGGRMLLRFCGTARTRLVTRKLIYSSTAFSANRVTWTDTRWIRDGAAVRETVRTLDVTTGRVRSWQFGNKPNLYVVHTRRHIFVDSERAAEYVKRYAIDLSQR